MFLGRRRRPVCTAAPGAPPGRNVALQEGDAGLFGVLPPLVSGVVRRGW
jgi:hypothetical protein